MKTISVSQNELTNVCLNAFRGICKQNGDATQIAKTIVDLEMLGLNGVKRYIAALEFIKKSPEKQAMIKREGKIIKANLRESSLIPYAGILVDYALSFMGSDNMAFIETSHSHDNWVILGLFEQVASQKLFLRGLWKDSFSGRTWLAMSIPSDPIPNIYTIEEGPPSIPNGVLTVDISPKKLSSIQTEVNPEIGETYHSQALKSNRKRSLEKGICISHTDWLYLKQQARTILVPTSEKSLSGAGE